MTLRWHCDNGLEETLGFFPDDGKQLGVERKTAESCAPLTPMPVSGAGGSTAKFSVAGFVIKI